MAQPKRQRFEDFARPAARPDDAPSFRLAMEGDDQTDSPARALQAQLDEVFGAAEVKWSPRRRTAFILATCGGFWALALLAAGWLLSR